MHVLLVEPDAITAKLSVAALTAKNYSVDWRRTAQAAVQAADAKRPDVVILELQLKEHNGIEFLYEFRSYPEWLAIPIILYTFTPLTDLRGTALTAELGIRQVLYKPETSLLQLCDAVQLQTSIQM